MDRRTRLATRVVRVEVAEQTTHAMGASMAKRPAQNQTLPPVAPLRLRLFA
jgi:hypothetical protein